MSDATFFLPFLLAILSMAAASHHSWVFLRTEDERHYRRMIVHGLMGAVFALIAIMMLIYSHGH